jgi:hypothetical protein
MDYNSISGEKPTSGLSRHEQGVGHTFSCEAKLHLPINVYIPLSTSSEEKVASYDYRCP